MSGLVCGVCGTSWKLDKPLLYHLGALHCDSHACSRTCEECQDWEEVVEAANPTDGDRKAKIARPAAATTSDSSFTKAPGYAAMMQKLKGGT